MLSLFFISPAYAATPNAANGGLDLVIILCCLGILTGIIYSIKFLIEKYRESRKSALLENPGIDTQKNPNS